MAGELGRKLRVGAEHAAQDAGLQAGERGPRGDQVHAILGLLKEGLKECGVERAGAVSRNAPGVRLHEAEQCDEPVVIGLSLGRRRPVRSVEPSCLSPRRHKVAARVVWVHPQLESHREVAVRQEAAVEKGRLRTEGMALDA